MPAFRTLVVVGIAFAVAHGFPSAATAKRPAAVSSLRIDALAGSEAWPAALRKMIVYALSLTEKNLSYRYGKSSPADGGMDCSGTIWHVLRSMGIADVPRSSAGMFEWVRESGRLIRIAGTPDRDDPLFAALRPGDLLFWTGTWNNGKPGRVSHVMMYLGRTTMGKPVMFGASDGRRYDGKRRSGVSVFDFKLPRPGRSARIVGFGPVPGTNIDGIPVVPPADPPEKRR